MMYPKLGRGCGYCQAISICSILCSQEGGVDAEYLSARREYSVASPVCGPWPEAIELVVNRRGDDEDSRF